MYKPKLTPSNIAIIVLAIFVVAYGAWMKWFKPTPLPTQGFVQPAPAVTEPKVSGPTVKLKVVPKKAVLDEFPQLPIADDEEVVDTADIDECENGATIIVKTDTVTGNTTTLVQGKEAPWFAFEDKNYVGVGAELYVDGEKKVKGYYKRDLLRIKNIHLQLGVSGKISDKKTVEGFAESNVEFRF